jgi:hypothetical protein
VKTVVDLAASMDRCIPAFEAGQRKPTRKQNIFFLTKSGAESPQDVDCAAAFTGSRIDYGSQ